MNSFFATCEQQVNYWLRGRPVAVCVYTGKQGCIIAPSIEAKNRGIKLGMRLHEAIKICPELVPLETHPNRYREFHVKVMQVLKKYSEDVIPKSIDEAVVDLTDYQLMYKDPVKLAKQIKKDIKEEVGDWMKCSIGIAPNAFLAKLASDIQKPDGLTLIFPDNIDEVLQKLKLTDLPGISKGLENRLTRAGIHSPYQLRHTPAHELKQALNSIVGIYWHHKLNFKEMDLMDHRYKSMQARRMISKAQRRSTSTLQDLFVTLCLTLERRMLKEGVFCNFIAFQTTYAEGKVWKDAFKTGRPIQDGMELMQLLQKHMQKFQELQKCEPIINQNITSMGITVTDFVTSDLIQCHLFEDSIRKDNLRKQVYDIKEKHGYDKLMRAIELKDEEVWKDAIGFGSVKDLHAKED